MKEKLKHRIFIVLAIGIILILSEILFNLVYGILFGAGVLLLLGSLFIKHLTTARIVAILGVVISGMAIFMTKSIWFFLVFIVVLYFLYNTDVGFEFAHFNEQTVHPFKDQINNSYQAVQIIQPQSNQRSRLSQRNMMEYENSEQTDFELHDINLIYFGGNNIVDFGNTMLPDKETVVVIQKLYGRIRVIVPIEVGISINVSAISGKVIFEQETYPLTGENFQWMSPDYLESPRQLRFVISVAFGDVEVIVL